MTAAAYGDGRLSGGQLQAIVANLSDRTAGLFAEHETELVPGFVDLSVAETATRMQSWARYADATLDDPPGKPEPESSLHVSRILDGRCELRGSFDPEAGSLIETAVRLATTKDVEGEPERSPARRRADALADVCRWFLGPPTGPPRWPPPAASERGHHAR